MFVLTRTQSSLYCLRIARGGGGIQVPGGNDVEGKDVEGKLFRVLRVHIPIRHRRPQLPPAQFLDDTKTTGYESGVRV